MSTQYLYSLSGREIESDKGKSHISKPYQALFGSPKKSPFCRKVGGGLIYDITPPGTNALSIEERVSSAKVRITTFSPKLFIYGEDCIIYGKTKRIDEEKTTIEVPRNLIEGVKERIAKFKKCYDEFKLAVKSEKTVYFRDYFNGELEERDFEVILDSFDKQNSFVNVTKREYREFIARKCGNKSRREHWENRDTWHLFND